LLVVLIALRKAFSVRTTHVWGPEDPWANNDWVGNLWMWWRTAQARQGQEWNKWIAWPAGGGDLNAVFPNRVDAWFAMPFADISALASWWNHQALLHIVCTAIALALLLRAAGVSRCTTAFVGAVALTAPIWLHELAGGRMATFVFWPGLLALAIATAIPRLRGTRLQLTKFRVLLPVTAGALTGLQFLAYPFHGAVTALLVAGVIATDPRSRWERAKNTVLAGAACMVLCLPSLLLWTATFQSGEVLAPPAGHTVLSLQGALGFGALPERLRLFPGLVLAIAAAATHGPSRRWALAALGVFVITLGPEIYWSPGHSSGIAAPMRAFAALMPPLERMHHPIREAPYLLATGAVALGLALDRFAQRFSSKWGQGICIACLPWLVAISPLDKTIAWEGAPVPEGVHGARFLSAGTGPVAHVTTRDHAGLPYQLWHRRPVLATTQGYAPPPDRPESPARADLVRATRDLVAGKAIDSALATLSEGGVTALLVTADASPSGQAFLAQRRNILVQKLGEPSFVDDTALVFRLPSN
jgi:hypothetical protein